MVHFNLDCDLKKCFIETDAFDVSLLLGSAPCFSISINSCDVNCGDRIRLSEIADAFRLFINHKYEKKYRGFLILSSDCENGKESVIYIQLQEKYMDGSNNLKNIGIK